MNYETRSYNGTELRAGDIDGEKPTLQGYAAVFDQYSETMKLLGKSFKEIIKPGAFTKSLESRDVHALFNHDSNLVLGRKRAGTLRITEDQTGLAVEIDPPNTGYARNLMESVKRGDISQMSIGFRCNEDVWRKEEDVWIRELREVELYEVSPVVFPAFSDTTIALRSLELANKQQDNVLALELKEKDAYLQEQFTRKRKLLALLILS
jgi:uncharacterized protein